MDIIDQIKDKVKKITSMAKSGSADINDIVVKETEGMPLEGIRRVIEETNVKNFLDLSKNGKEKSASFPIADPYVVFEKLGTKLKDEVDLAGKKMADRSSGVDDGFYSKEPESETESCAPSNIKGDGELKDIKIDEESIDEIDNANRGINPNYIGTRGSDKKARKEAKLMDKMDETIKQAQAHYHDELYSSMGSLINKIRNDDYRANKAFSTMYSIHGEEIVPFMSSMAKTASVKLSYKHIPTIDNNDLCKLAARVSELAQKTVKLDKAISSYDLKKKEQITHRTKQSEDCKCGGNCIRTNAIRSMMDKEAAGGDPTKGRGRNSQIERDKKRKAEREKQKAEMSKLAPPGSSEYYKTLIYDWPTFTAKAMHEQYTRENQDKAVEEAAKAVKKKKEESKFINPWAMAGVDSFGNILDGWKNNIPTTDAVTTAKELEQKRYDSRYDFVDDLSKKLKQKAIFTDLINNDPILKEMDPKGLFNLYSSLSKISEDAIMNKELVRGWLRVSKGQDVIAPESIKVLSDIQKNLKDIRRKSE